MEKCQECGRDFVISGRRQEKRIEVHQSITGKVACDPCIKKIKKQAMDEVIREAVHNVLEKRMIPDPETIDEIVEHDPVFDAMKEEE